jgi:vesicle transport protein SEC22
MVKLTMIARVLDGLPLAEGLDTDASLDLEYYKQQAKTLFKKLGQNSSSSHASGAGGAPPSRMSYESGEYFMHYVIESGVCYLTLCERNYPKKLAYSYLEGERKQNSFLFFARIRFD